ncbi:2OG-Fe(II) oxygenase [Streptacidiphilus neutrinimicus]|uniref:2OG-Fe(II) oxygenase n=1 Tax=Streptacidiphilus neutrinimicus TaxID=105420 RepID=UPI000694CD05|nr:2OG-Fe(II) oxygenase [Streptacidiphilus neutrinimicus]
MLDLDAPVTAHETPYTWAQADGLLPQTLLERLRGTLPPTEVFDRKERARGGDKAYAMHVLPLVQDGGDCEVLDRLDPVWRDLADALRAPAYLQWVERAVKVPVSARHAEIGLFVFGPGDYVSRHTDKAGKLASHVLYLNEDWGADDGGAFEVYGDDDAPYAALSPQAPRSVVFARSESSWHAVEPVRADATRLRCTIQVELWA